MLVVAACLSLTACTASESLGRSAQGAGANSAPAHQAWKPRPPHATGEMRGVSAISSSDVWAVGSPMRGGAMPLIEHWNGQVWARVPSPTPSRISPQGAVSLAGVAGVSSDDVWAVGQYLSESPTVSNGLIEHWDGTAWKDMAVPQVRGSQGSSGLLGVAATSANDVWAVGFYYDGTAQRSLALHWDGHTWQAMPTPKLGEFANLWGVSATSDSNAWAVGQYKDNSEIATLALHWDGSTWKQIETPAIGSGPELRAVTAIAEDDVWAVGSYSDTKQVLTLALHWDGSTWQRVVTPSPARGVAGALTRLTGVTAASEDNVWASGTLEYSRTKDVVLHWDGHAWSRIAVPVPRGFPGGMLWAIDAAGGNNAWAVGRLQTRRQLRPLVLQCCR